MRLTPLCTMRVFCVPICEFMNWQQVQKVKFEQVWSVHGARGDGLRGRLRKSRARGLDVVVCSWDMKNSSRW